MSILHQFVKRCQTFGNQACKMDRIWVYLINVVTFSKDVVDNLAERLSTSAKIWIWKSSRFAQTCANLVDLKYCRKISIYMKKGFDTAEVEPSKIILTSPRFWNANVLYWGSLPNACWWLLVAVAFARSTVLVQCLAAPIAFTAPRIVDQRLFLTGSSITSFQSKYMAPWE